MYLSQTTTLVKVDQNLKYKLSFLNTMWNNKFINKHQHGKLLNHCCFILHSFL